MDKMNGDSVPIMLTIGHSNRKLDDLMGLLIEHHVTIIADVRSYPVSRYVPWFSRKPLHDELRGNGIKYAWLGGILGARTSEDSCYDSDGRVSYDALSHTRGYSEGLDRLECKARSLSDDDGMLAVLCTEADPLKCHRGILIAPMLEARGITVSHILWDEPVESHAAAMRRLCREHKIIVSTGDDTSDSGGNGITGLDSITAGKHEHSVSPSMDSPMDSPMDSSMSTRVSSLFPAAAVDRSLLAGWSGGASAEREALLLRSRRIAWVDKKRVAR